VCSAVDFSNWAGLIAELKVDTFSKFDLSSRHYFFCNAGPG
jgi:hypothetical protein